MFQSLSFFSWLSHVHLLCALSAHFNEDSFLIIFYSQQPSPEEDPSSEDDEDAGVAFLLDVRSLVLMRRRSQISSYMSSTAYITRVDRLVEDSTVASYHLPSNRALTRSPLKRTRSSTTAWDARRSTQGRRRRFLDRSEVQLSPPSTAAAAAGGESGARQWRRRTREDGIVRCVDET